MWIHYWSNEFSAIYGLFIQIEPRFVSHGVDMKLDF